MATIKDEKLRKQREQQAISFYESRGWLPHQARGIVGNLLHESGLQTSAEGDIGYKGGSSFGLAQWRGDRLRRIKEKYGNQWKDFNNQLEFVDWELRNTHKNAGEALKSAKNLDDAGRVISDMYEIPAKKWKDAKDRRDKVYSLSNTHSNKTVTNDFIDFEIPKTNNTFASVPDVYKEEKVDEDIQEVKQKTNEYNFLKDIYSQQEELPQQTQEEQQSVLPQTDVLGTFNSVSQFVDTPVMQEGGKFLKNELDFLSEISIKDNKGQYNHPGKITQISSPRITMKNIKKPILGISKETGEKKIMMPDLEYFFKNTKNVIEIPYYDN